MKYMGSKLKISKYIVPIIQEAINKETVAYVEPFVGGCNIIDKIQHTIKYGNDINIYLIALLKKLINDGYSDYFLPQLIDREHYNEVREFYNFISKNNNEITSRKFSDWYIGLVGFLASYNGRFFDGGYSGINTSPTGKVRNYYVEAKGNLLKQIEILKNQNIKFSNKDYLEFLESNNFQNCVIYLDPPYKDTKQYKSHPLDYDIFYNICRKLNENNKIFISEQWMPNDFICLFEEKVKRTIIKGKNKKETIERLYTIR